MKTIILILSIIALIISGLWVYHSGFDYEPLIGFILGIVGMLYFFQDILKGNKAGLSPSLKQSNKQTVNVNVNVSKELDETKKVQNEGTVSNTREFKIESMKSKVRILFIDDDKNFKVVRILKESGWKNTKSVIDIKNIDIPIVKETDIFFVDINGVGKILECENEGLDLALMLKQKYPDKKVVIYSANKKNNVFHKAWDECDFKLEKNALPYQFQSLVEQYSISR